MLSDVIPKVDFPVIEDYEIIGIKSPLVSIRNSNILVEPMYKEKKNI